MAPWRGDWRGAQGLHGKGLLTVLLRQLAALSPVLHQGRCQRAWLSMWVGSVEG